MPVSQAKIQEMFKAIPDPKMRQQLSSIMTSTEVKSIHCTSKKCKGRVIGHVLDNGNVTAITDKDGQTYLRAWRNRLDGFLGFECWCGNDSRLAPQEKGHIGANAPTKSDLQKVWEKVNGKPSDYKTVKGEQNIDGFVIKEIA